MELLPIDAQFKGYEEVIIQDITFGTDNVFFVKQKYYSPQNRKTYFIVKNYFIEFIIFPIKNCCNVFA